jgi:circadian clock protein KaiB
MAEFRETTFLLFVAGDSPNSRLAIANLRRALGDEDFEVVDVYEHPDKAADYNVFVTPTLLRRADPRARLYGDLSRLEPLKEFLR